MNTTESISSRLDKIQRYILTHNLTTEEQRCIETFLDNFEDKNFIDFRTFGEATKYLVRGWWLSEAINQTVEKNQLDTCPVCFKEFK